MSSHLRLHYMLSFSFPVHIYLHLWSLHCLHIHKDRWVSVIWINTVSSGLCLTSDFNILSTRSSGGTRVVPLILQLDGFSCHWLSFTPPTEACDSVLLPDGCSALPHPPLPLHRSCFLWHEPHLQSTAYTWHIFTVPEWKCTWKYFKTWWGKRSLPESMKDSKWSMLLSMQKTHESIHKSA